jgi:hypothetical protein
MRRSGEEVDDEGAVSWHRRDRTTFIAANVGAGKLTRAQLVSETARRMSRCR